MSTIPIKLKRSIVVNEQTQSIEANSLGLPWLEVLDKLSFNNDGLIPAIAQQFDSGEVLMLAWMNRTALEETVKTGQVCYWSRSRNRLWRKGESSGQTQLLRELRIDCDADTLLLLVDQTGPACHTGRRSCFFHALNNNKVEIISPVLINPNDLYNS